MDARYMLEVQKFITEPLENKGFLHIGYMKRVFKTKKDAAEYYDKYNPHMRSLNGHNTYKSDWDPKTELRYLVRNYNFEILTIEPFNPNHTYGVIKGSNDTFIRMGNIDNTPK